MNELKKIENEIKRIWLAGFLAIFLLLFLTTLKGSNGTSVEASSKKIFRCENSDLNGLGYSDIECLYKGK